MVNKKIRVAFILEILGRPPEHISKILAELVEQLGTEKGIKVISSDIHQPKKIEGQKEETKEVTVEAELYTAFASIEIEVEELSNLLVILFKYMPSHLEFISPERLEVSNTELRDLLIDILSRMHRYDEITRTVIEEKNILENQLRMIYQKIREQQEMENRMRVPSMKVTTNAKEESVKNSEENKKQSKKAKAKKK